MYRPNFLKLYADADNLTVAHLLPTINNCIIINKIGKKIISKLEFSHQNSDSLLLLNLVHSCVNPRRDAKRTPPPFFFLPRMGCHIRRMLQRIELDDLCQQWKHHKFGRCRSLLLKID